jgi:predicted glycoside hydrolase/deacetylase ChbG (UPF0249 family)
MRNAFLRQLDFSILRAEIKAQITLFRDAIGRLPDYIDGHQHVHQFPCIQEALLSVYEEFYPSHNAAIRVSAQPHWRDNFSSAKAFLLAATGAMTLRKQLRKRGIPHNTSFAGIYNFSAQSDYSCLFRHFLKSSTAGGLIMCHPGLPTDDPRDVIGPTRGREYQFLMHHSRGLTQ